MFSKIQRRLSSDLYFFSKMKMYARELISQIERELPNLGTFVIPGGAVEALLAPLRAAILTEDDANIKNTMQRVQEAILRIRNSMWKASTIITEIAGARLAQYIIKPNEFKLFVSATVEADKGGPMRDVDVDLITSICLSTASDVPQWSMIEGDEMILAAQRMLRSISASLDASASDEPNNEGSETIKPGEDLAGIGRLAQMAAVLSLLTKPESLLTFFSSGFAPGGGAIMLRQATVDRLAGFFHALSNLPYYADIAGLMFTYDRIDEIAGPIPGTPELNLAKQIYDAEVLNYDVLGFMPVVKHVYNTWLTDINHSNVKGIPFEFVRKGVARSILERNGAATPHITDDEISVPNPESSPVRAALAEAFGSPNSVVLSGEQRRLLTNFPTGVTYKPFNMADAMEFANAFAVDLRTLAVAAGAYNRLLLSPSVTQALKSETAIQNVIIIMEREWIPEPSQSTDIDFYEDGSIPAVCGTLPLTADGVSAILTDSPGSISTCSALRVTLHQHATRRGGVDHSRRARLKAIEQGKISMIPSCYGSSTQPAFFRSALRDARQAETIIAQLAGVSGRPLHDLLNAGTSGSLIATAVSCIGLFTRADDVLITGQGMPYGLSYPVLFEKHTSREEGVKLGHGITFYPLKTVPVISTTLDTFVDYRQVSHPYFKANDAKIIIEAFVVDQPMAHFALFHYNMDSWFPQTLFNRTYLHSNDALAVQTERAPKSSLSTKRRALFQTFDWMGLSLTATRKYYGVGPLITAPAPTVSAPSDIESELKKVQQAATAIDEKTANEKSEVTPAGPEVATALEASAKAGKGGSDESQTES